MGLYKKKPIIIEAYQLTKFNLPQISHWMKRECTWIGGGEDIKLVISTLEGKMSANLGDYIIQGIRGEFYPCKEDVFNETYEKVI